MKPIPNPQSPRPEGAPSMPSSHLPSPLEWPFPIRRPHAGPLLGNGVQGIMVWGEDALVLTVGRAGFWDHRGGNPFTTRATYAQLRAWLEADDRGALERFAGTEAADDGRPSRPYQIGGGRLKLPMPEGWRLETAVLHPAAGRIVVSVRHADGQGAEIGIRQARHGQEVAWIDLPPDWDVAVELIPSWAFVGDKLQAWGVAPPARLGDGQSEGAFEQSLPEDPGLGLAWSRRESRLVVATALAEADAGQAALDRARTADVDALGRDADADWAAYWDAVPWVRLPDPDLQEIYEYGAYKQAGLTPPDGVAATLQGPWMEDYQLPPWSNDYHFNINIEMIYWPCLLTGRTDHLGPLWSMLRSWMPVLRANAKAFFGDDQAMMLPHAVDDRCQVVGTFWTGMIDHACTAWMAQLAWLHVRYSGDETVLREVAWPLLTGAFNGYWSMSEEIPEPGGILRRSLPVTVSPEFRGSDPDAWGRDASFQLAAWHRVARILPEAARVLGEPVDPRWAEIEAALPAYSVVEGPRHPDRPSPVNQRIGLWEGQDLTESHRHHSHLAAIYPFATVDPFDPEHAKVVRDSFFHWVRTGPGAWSGWCVPWASTLHARLNRGDAAVALLKFWRDNFVNEGRGTLHDSFHPGLTTLAAHHHGREEMQMDAGMGALTAVCELLVQSRDDAIAVLPSLPTAWREAEFDGLRAEGGFRIGATVRDERVVEVRVTSERGEPLALRLPWDPDHVVRRETRAGEALVFTHPGPG